MILAICEECKAKQIRKPADGRLGLCLWGCSLCGKPYEAGGGFTPISKRYFNRSKTYLRRQHEARNSATDSVVQGSEPVAEQSGSSGDAGPTISE